jgi:hypothetical protein
VAKYPTFPVCFDATTQLSISYLQSAGLLRPDAKATGPVSWSRGGEPSGSITVEANLPERYIELRYICRDIPINYRVRLESVKKHFGGHEWYFVCPFAEKRCKKLYLIEGYFRSRYACPEAMYSSQTYSKSVRTMLAEYFAMDEVEQFLSKPYARTHYKGKITKRYARLLERERRVLMSPAVQRRYMT